MQHLFYLGTGMDKALKKSPPVQLLLVSFLGLKHPESPSYPSHQTNWLGELASYSPKTELFSALVPIKKGRKASEMLVGILKKTSSYLQYILFFWNGTLLVVSMRGQLFYKQTRKWETHISPLVCQMNAHNTIVPLPGQKQVAEIIWGWTTTSLFESQQLSIGLNPTVLQPAHKVPKYTMVITFMIIHCNTGRHILLLPWNKSPVNYSKM